jgi:hypothetical protein
MRALDFYASPGSMTRLPSTVGATDIPSDLDEMRRVVQGALLHRDWAPAYGVTGDAIRTHEQNLRSVDEVLTRLFEIRSAPITEGREPVDRVLGICRHFTLLHTALLRANGTPARVRCGFGNYFDRSKWYDHWITERWDGRRWVRDDPQIDELQASVIKIDFDPNDQPDGQFLTGGEAWAAVRAGDADAQQFGIFDMWGMAFIGGNVLSDFACLNKVELLPWGAWGIGVQWGPHDELDDRLVAFLDDLAKLANSDDFDVIRDRYEHDDDVRVPAEIVTMIDGQRVDAQLDLT